MIEVQRIFDNAEQMKCGSNCETHSGYPVLRVHIGDLTSVLCEQCCHRLFNALGYMTSTVSELTLPQMIGTTKRPRTFAFNVGEWKRGSP